MKDTSFSTTGLVFKLVTWRVRRGEGQRRRSEGARERREKNRTPNAFQSSREAGTRAVTRRGARSGLRRRHAQVHQPAVQGFALLNHVILLQELLQGEALLVEHELRGGGARLKRGRADCGQFRARTRSGRALERGRGRARACPEEGSAASRSETDAEAPRGRHRDGRIGRAAESGGSEASRCCSDRASGRAPREVGTDAKIARSSRSAKRRTSTGDACTSPGDLQNMIPLSREVGRRAGARRSARARGRGRDERSRTDEAERSRPSRVDASHAAHLDRFSTDNGHFQNFASDVKTFSSRHAFDDDRERRGENVIAQKAPFLFLKKRPRLTCSSPCR